MQKRGILLVLLVVSWTGLKAQELSHQVLVVAANVANGSGYSISQTVGEPIVDFISSEKYDLTQGFQQPSCSLVTPQPPLGNGVNVYPNPVIDDLKVEMFGETGMEYELTIFGIDGSVYYRNRYECTGKFWRLEVLDVSGFKRGLYFVRVEASNKKIARLFKIEKM